MTGRELTGGILARDDGATIAYHRRLGVGPGIVFLHGFRSDMTGTKAMVLDSWCAETGRAFVRFDAYGHGLSSGDFALGTIGRWADDAVAVLDHLTTGPQILVGSSMGGWLMLLAALARRERVAGLLGLAAAPDFTEDSITSALTEAHRQALARDGQFIVPDCYGGPDYPITARLIAEGRDHLVLRAPIPLRCPVRLIHGQQDGDVPWSLALRLAEQLESSDVEVTLVKSAGHRLSETVDLRRMIAAVEALIAAVP